MVQQLSERRAAPVRSGALPRAPKSSDNTASRTLPWRFGAATVIACVPALALTALSSGAENDAALEAEAAAFRASMQRPEPPLVTAPQAASGKSAKLEVKPRADADRPDVRAVAPDMPARFAALDTGKPVFARTAPSAWMAQGSSGSRAAAPPAPAEPNQAERAEPRAQARGAAEPDATGSLRSAAAPAPTARPRPPASPAEAGSQEAAAGTGAPTECLPQELRTVLSDLKGRFGQVTIVSTTHLHTENHSSGGARHKLHLACKAVDIKTQKPVPEVLAYLRSRPELAGISSYRNGVIHIDVNPRVGQAGLGSTRRASLP